MRIKTLLNPRSNNHATEPELTGLGGGSRLGWQLGGGWLRARRLLLRLGLLLRCRGGGQQLRGVVVVVGAKEFEGIDGRHGDGGGEGHTTLAYL